MGIVPLVIVGCLVLAVIEVLRFANESQSPSSPVADLIQGGLLVGIGVLIVALVRRRRP
jgi:hypothetical protein